MGTEHPVEPKYAFFITFRTLLSICFAKGDETPRPHHICIGHPRSLDVLWVRPDPP